jgi:hypothetical protein
MWHVAAQQSLAVITEVWLCYVPMPACCCCKPLSCSDCTLSRQLLKLHMCCVFVAGAAAGQDSLPLTAGQAGQPAQHVEVRGAPTKVAYVAGEQGGSAKAAKQSCRMPFPQLHQHSITSAVHSCVVGWFCANCMVIQCGGWAGEKFEVAGRQQLPLLMLSTMQVSACVSSHPPLAVKHQCSAVRALNSCHRHCSVYRCLLGSTPRPRAPLHQPWARSACPRVLL